MQKSEIIDFFAVSHVGPEVVSMANKGPNTNGRPILSMHHQGTCKISVAIINLLGYFVIYQSIVVKL